MPERQGPASQVISHAVEGVQTPAAPEIYIDKLRSTIDVLQGTLRLQREALTSLEQNPTDPEALAQLRRLNAVIQELCGFQTQHIDSLQTLTAAQPNPEAAPITAAAVPDAQPAIPRPALADSAVPARQSKKPENPAETIDRLKNYTVTIDETVLSLTGLQIELIAVVREQGNISLEQLASRVGITKNGADRVRNIIKGMQRRFHEKGLAYNALHISSTGQVSLRSELIRTVKLPSFPTPTTPNSGTPEAGTPKTQKQHPVAMSPANAATPEYSTQTETFISNLTPEQTAKVRKFVIADLVKTYGISEEHAWRVLAEIFGKTETLISAFNKPNYYSLATLQLQWKTKIRQALASEK